jgi:hypothetical protein
MALFLIDQAKVNVYSVSIKFGRTVKVTSLKNENFKVYKDVATPVLVSAPFDTIDTIKDYNQISRTLTLYWRTTLENNQDYYIDVVNLVDASGSVVTSEKVTFTYVTSATPSTEDYRTPILSPVLIEDKSIKTDIDISYQVLAKNPKFYIDSVDPGNGSFYIENDFNNGRAIIIFNERPASNFLSNRYFIVQRKKIQKAPSRWENLTTNVSMHSWKPEVYIDFPSLDATPSFFADNKDYFEKGYKYRITVSKDIGI